MNQSQAMALILPEKIIELDELSIEHSTEKSNQAVDEFCAKLRKRGLAKRQALTIAMLGILATPVLAIFSSGENQLEKLQLLIESDRTGNDKSAILAVDTSGVRIRSNRASAATLEMFEQTTIEHLAQLHSTYRAWAEKNQVPMGSLLIKLFVDAGGTVARVESSASRLSNSEFIRTIVASAREWKFPKSSAGATEITVPLLFIPKGIDSDTVVQWERTVRGTADAQLISAEMTNAKPVSIQTLPIVRAAALAQSAPVISRVKAEPAPLPTVKANRQLAIRDLPRYSGKSLRDVDEETPLNIVENRGDWLKVKLADAGPIGYVRKEYVSPIN